MNRVTGTGSIHVNSCRARIDDSAFCTPTAPAALPTEWRRMSPAAPKK